MKYDAKPAIIKAAAEIDTDTILIRFP
jgi:hypothetical protein